MLTDDELLRAWRGGDRPAGARLFDRHFKVLSRFFRNKVGSDADADDLIQATMLGLLEAHERFRGEGEFRSFVFGVAYNVLRKHYDRERRDGQRVDLGVSSVFDLAEGPSRIVAEHEEQRMLLAALRRIPVEHQVLLELYFWEPLPAPEIARVLGVPVGTVRTRIRRAKALLEAELGRVGEGPPLESTLSNLDDWARSVRDDMVR